MSGDKFVVEMMEVPYIGRPAKHPWAARKIFPFIQWLCQPTDPCILLLHPPSRPRQAVLHPRAARPRGLLCHFRPRHLARLRELPKRCWKGLQARSQSGRRSCHSRLRRCFCLCDLRSASLCPRHPSFTSPHCPFPRRALGHRRPYRRERR